MWAVYVVIVATYGPLLSESKNLLRVYNGVDDDTCKYPYVVALKPEMKPKHYVERLCTGSLIAENWVITAAECLSNLVKYIQYGNLSLPLADTEKKSNVIKMIPHPRVFPALHTNNIGLVLVKAVSMNRYASISAVDYVTLQGHPVEYAGYGMTFLPKRKSGSKKQSKQKDLLRRLQIGEGAIKSCSVPFNKNFICLSSKCSHTQQILFGDVGAPLFCDGKIIGVACAFMIDENEQIFTPVSPYLAWIHQVITTQG